MPRLIFKCSHLKSGVSRSAAHRKNYVEYMATRPRVEPMPAKEAALPATKKQMEMVERLTREFPLSRGMFEYEDYQSSPTRAAASAFITRAIEDNLDQLGKRENYLDYIANRPRVQKMGAHGLFNGTDERIVLSQVADTIAHHPGTVWLPVISLRREDADRLGYNSAGAWKGLLSSCASKMAKAMKIPQERFRWYAAFHDEGHHPHVHMVCYSEDGKSGFLTKQGLDQIRSMLAREIFKQELTEIYQKQTLRRDELVRDAGETMRGLIDQMESGTLENERVIRLMEHLALCLRDHKGKKQYGYLKAELKSVVDEIVDELARDPRVAQAYDLWYELREEVLRTYRNDMPDRLPLSHQKEFRRIKNLVIEEAARLGETSQNGQGNEYAGDKTSTPSESTIQTVQTQVKLVTEIPVGDLLQSVSRLLHHMGRIFREETHLPPAGVRFTDKKLRQRIREKKMAMGHKADDHEEQQMT